MKRTEFLKYLRTHGCEFIREGARLLGGGIPAKTNAPPYRDIRKSVIALPGRYAETLE
jgi:hypothetical protein